MAYGPFNTGGANAFHAATHAADGSDPLAPGAIGAADLLLSNLSDIAAARTNLGAAPAGYGYGGEAVAQIVPDSASESDAVYLARFEDVISAMASGSAMQVRAVPPRLWGGSYLTAIWKVTDAYAVVEGRAAIEHPSAAAGWRVRYISGAWSEIEYEAPALAVGVEYRTTERYLGKPVYAKVLNCGSLPNATTKTVGHGISDFQYGISCELTSPTNCVAYTNALSITGTWLDPTQVTIVTATDLSANVCYATLKYTKTTD